MRVDPAAWCPKQAFSNSDLSWILIHGPNADLRNALVAECMANAPTFKTLSENEWVREGAALFQPDLFGAPKPCLWIVEKATDLSAKPAELRALPADQRVLFVAETLFKTSPWIGLADREARAARLVCFEQTFAQVCALLKNRADRAGLTFAPDALTFLAESLEHTLRWVPTFRTLHMLFETKTIARSDLDSVLRPSVKPFVDVFLRGDFAEAAALLDTFEDDEPMLVLRILSKKICQLYQNQEFALGPALARLLKIETLFKQNQFFEAKPLLLECMQIFSKKDGARDRN